MRVTSSRILQHRRYLQSAAAAAARSSSSQHLEWSTPRDLYPPPSILNSRRFQRILAQHSWLRGIRQGPPQLSPHVAASQRAALPVALR